MMGVSAEKLNMTKLRYRERILRIHKDLSLGAL